MICPNCSHKLPKPTPRRSSNGFRDDLGASYRSSWEANFARLLRHQGIAFEYEPLTYYFPNVKRGAISYLPDFYLPSLDIYIEVKGHMTSKDRTKMKRLKQHHPEVFSKVRFVIKSPSVSAQSFLTKQGIPIYAYYGDLTKQYKSVLPNWE